MQLLTKEIQNKLPAIRATEDQNEVEIICKFFTPDANWTWFVVEGEKLENGDFEFWGLVDGLEREFGYFTLSQLKQARGQFGLPVERDRHFTGTLNKEERTVK